MRHACLFVLFAAGLMMPALAAKDATLAEDVAVVDAIVGTEQSKSAAQALLRQKYAWRTADKLELLTFLDTAKPRVVAAVIIGERKLLDAVEADLIAGLLRAIEQNQVGVSKDYPYHHRIYDGGPKRVAIKLLGRLRAADALRRLVYFPFGDGMDAHVLYQSVVDAIVEVQGLGAADFFDRTQRDARQQKWTRVAGSMGILKLAEIDRSNKTVRAGLEYATNEALAPIVRAQAKSALEGREDPVRAAAKQFLDSMNRPRVTEPVGIWKQPRTMSGDELVNYMTEQMEAYRPRNILAGDTSFPDYRYDGKIVTFPATTLSKSAFTDGPHAVFIDSGSGKSFNAYGIRRDSRILSFSERFFLIGTWTSVVQRNDSLRLSGIEVHKICGVAVRQQSATAHVLCDTLVQAGK